MGKLPFKRVSKFPSECSSEDNHFSNTQALDFLAAVADGAASSYKFQSVADTSMHSSSSTSSEDTNHKLTIDNVNLISQQNGAEAFVAASSDVATVVDSDEEY